MGSPWVPGKCRPLRAPKKRVTEDGNVLLPRVQAERMEIEILCAVAHLRPPQCQPPPIALRCRFVLPNTTRQLLQASARGGRRRRRNNALVLLTHQGGMPTGANRRRTFQGEINLCQACRASARHEMAAKSCDDGKEAQHTLQPKK